MKTLNLTPDTLHRILTLTNAAALPDPAASNLLDFVHETVRNAETTNDAALTLLDASEILRTCNSLLADYKQPHIPGGVFQRATELQYGEGAELDQQINLIFISALLRDPDTRQPLTDAGDLLRDLGHALYTPEDEDEQ